MNKATFAENYNSERYNNKKKDCNQITNTINLFIKNYTELRARSWVDRCYIIHYYFSV